MTRVIVRRAWAAAIIATAGVCVFQIMRLRGPAGLNRVEDLVVVTAPFITLAILLLVPMTVAAVRDFRVGPRLTQTFGAFRLVVAIGGWVVVSIMTAFLVFSVMRP